MDAKRRTTVLVVDDSAAVRQTLAAIIEPAPDIDLIGSARDPVHAAEIIRAQVPDVITLDVEMPRMDGITFLRRLMAQCPIPVIVCSSLVGEGTRTLMDALDAGAVDVIEKPKIGTKSFLEDSAIRVLDAIRAASRARLSPRGAQRPGSSAPKAPRPTAPRRPAPMAKTTQAVVAVGASTGGTEALRRLVEAMPPYAPPLVIVQHMPAAFTRAFAERLDALAEITVAEARDGDTVLRGRALIAPGDRHMRLHRSGATYYVSIEDGPLVNRHRPSADVLFDSVAETAGANAVGVILTGMGRDGAEGLGRMRAAGAVTIGQDEASCVVYGMPREAKRIGALTREAPLADIGPLVIKHAAGDG